MAAPAPAQRGAPIPPALLQQMMAQQGHQAAPPQAAPQQGGSPPPLPPAVLQALIAQKAQAGQAPAPQGAQQGGSPMPATLPTPQGGQPTQPPPQGQPPAPLPRSVPLPPGALAGQGANPPPPGLTPPGASHPTSAPGQMPPQMPPQMLQQLLAQKAQQAQQPPLTPAPGGAAMGGPPVPQTGANPPQLPPQVLQQLLAQKAAQGGQPMQGAPQQGGQPNIPPAVMQQVQAAKQAIATGQPMPQGPIPPDMLKQMISHATLLNAQVVKTGLQPSQMSKSQLEDAGVAHAVLSHDHTVSRNGKPGLAVFAQSQGASPPDAHAPIATQAKDGVGGDKLMAHLTPGEISLPPALQNPQVLAALKDAFAKGGVDMSAFTAGSKQSSINPKTGKPQYDLFSSILPMAAMAVTAVFAPELLPAEAGWAVPLVVGAAGAGATLATGGTWQQAALTGVGGAVGGYMGGLSGGAAASAADVAAADAAAGATIDPALLAADGTAILPPSAAEVSAAQAAQAAPLSAGTPISGGSELSASSLATPAVDLPHYDTTTGQLLDSSGQATGNAWDAATMQARAGLAQPTSMMGKMTGKSLGFGSSPDHLGSATVGQALSPISGAMLASSLAPTTVPSSLSNSTQLPAGFSDHKPAPTQDFGSINGSHVQNTPSFAGYNPYTAVTGIDPATGQPSQAGFSFFPQPGQNPIAQNTGASVSQPGLVSTPTGMIPPGAIPPGMIAPGMIPMNR